MASEDQRQVRARFIELLRERTPDHPFVRQHDAKVAAARAPFTLEELVGTTCDECPNVWAHTCACNGWCMKTDAILPDPVRSEA